MHLGMAECRVPLFGSLILMTLTSDIVFRINVSGVFHLYYMSWGSQIWCVAASWYGRVSCGKCVLGAYFFRYHKTITIKASWTGQDLACSPETVEGSLFIETVLTLFWKSAI